MYFLTEIKLNFGNVSYTKENTKNEQSKLQSVACGSNQGPGGRVSAKVSKSFTLRYFCSGVKSEVQFVFNCNNPFLHICLLLFNYPMNSAAAVAEFSLCTFPANLIKIYY